MISVIISTKNGALLIDKSVKSVLEQNYNDFEIIIISDGSTDNTVEVVKKLQEKDSRIKLYELRNNVGPGRARDLAIQGGEIEGVSVPSCSGEYIALIDDDDLWISKDKLSIQKDFLDKNKDFVTVGSSHVAFVSERAGNTWWLKNSTDPEHIRKSMLGYNPIITSSVMFRKDTYITCGGFSSMYLAEDYDLWLSMGKYGKITNLDRCDTQYTIRDGGASKSRQMEMNKIVLSLAIKYRKDYPNFLYAFTKGWARIILLHIKNLLK